MKTTTIQGSGEAPHKIGDVLYINSERWAVYRIAQHAISYTMCLKPLGQFVGSTKLISIPGFEGTVSDYIELLCNEYEDGCCC